jgi:hypothetical protein
LSYATVTNSGTSYTDKSNFSASFPDRYYHYRVTAWQDNGVQSAFSNPMKAKLSQAGTGLTVQMTSPSPGTLSSSPVSLVATIVTTGNNASVNFYYRLHQTSGTTPAWKLIAAGQPSSPGSKTFTRSTNLPNGKYDFRALASDDANLDDEDIVANVEVLKVKNYTHIAWRQGQITWGPDMETGSDGKSYPVAHITAATEICGVTVDGSPTVRRISLPVPYQLQVPTHFATKNGQPGRSVSYVAHSGATPAGADLITVGFWKIEESVSVAEVRYRIGDSGAFVTYTGGTVSVKEGEIVTVQAIPEEGKIFPNGYPTWGGLGSGRVGPSVSVLILESSRTGQFVSVKSKSGATTTIPFNVENDLGYVKPEYEIKVNRVDSSGTPINSSAGSEAIVAAGAKSSTEHTAVFQIKVTRSGEPLVNTPVQTPTIVNGESYAKIHSTQGANDSLSATVSMKTSKTDGQGIVWGYFTSSDMQRDVQLKVAEQPSRLATIRQWWVDSPNDASNWVLPVEFAYDKAVRIVFRPLLKGTDRPIRRHAIQFMVTQATVNEWNETSQDYESVVHKTDADDFVAFGSAAGNDDTRGVYATNMTVSSQLPAGQSGYVENVIVNAEDWSVWLP